MSLQHGQCTCRVNSKLGKHLPYSFFDIITDMTRKSIMKISDEDVSILIIKWHKCPSHHNEFNLTEKHTISSVYTELIFKVILMKQKDFYANAKKVLENVYYRVNWE